MLIQHYTLSEKTVPATNALAAEPEAAGQSQLFYQAKEESKERQEEELVKAEHERE